MRDFKKMCTFVSVIYKQLSAYLLRLYPSYETIENITVLNSVSCDYSYRRMLFYYICM